MTDSFKARSNVQSPPLGPFFTCVNVQGSALGKSLLINYSTGLLQKLAWFLLHCK